MRSPLLLLASVLLATARCIGADSAPAPSPAALRVMTFNVRNSSARDGEDHWTRRKELFAETVRAFDPDLLGLQEVLADQYDDLQKLFPEYAPVGVARDDGARKGEWAEIMYRKSRFEAVRTGDFWLSEEPEKAGTFGWDAACVRICSWAKLRDRNTGTEFLFANTHFDHKGESARVNSALLLAERLPMIAHGSPVILTGDFNCTEESAAYKTLVRPAAEGSGKVRLLDSFREVHPSKAPDEASFHGFKGTTAGARIDWILHTPQLTPTAAEIIRTKNAEGRYPSDHFPVTATFQFTPPDAPAAADTPAGK